jgi:hypothetical protein
VGDSTALHHSNETAVKETKSRFISFLETLESYARGEHFPFVIKMRDPLGNSFISAPLGLTLPPEADANLTLTDFVRSFEENEEFGLNDMNTKDFETGVVYEEHTRPDRLTHVTVKGIDHPTFYAKGVEDATTGGGVFVTTTSAVSDVTVDRKPFASAHVPEEDEVDSDYGKRKFNDDSDLKFEAREEWGGARDGFVFRLGSLGLGYYQDRLAKRPLL